ncbi:MAG TPA: hypothetical protein VE978_04595 [Chitinophagales bacterium]|nr:hypothetical protein [Chitinophagales bacterium]
MNNWFGLFNFLLAKKQLNENGITDTPPEMLFSLLPGMKIPPIHQLIETREVVKRRIEEDVNAGLNSKVNLLSAENTLLESDKTGLTADRSVLLKGAQDILALVNNTSDDSSGASVKKGVTDLIASNPDFAKLLSEEGEGDEEEGDGSPLNNKSNYGSGSPGTNQ